MAAIKASDPKLNEINESLDLPNVSVVIAIYNGEYDLPNLLTCIHAQTYPQTHVEYLLVDNRSEDKTPEIIHTAAKEAKIKGLKIRYVSEHQIQGPSAARNAGIRESQGEIIAFTDVDCRPDAGWLSSLVKPFSDPEVGVVGGAITPFPGETLLEQYAIRKKTLSHHYAHTQELPFGMTANLAVRRAALEKVGLFRLILCEDVDMCWRIQVEGGWKFYSEVTATIQHRHRNNLRSLFKQWRGYGHGYQCIYQLYGVEVIPRVNWHEYYRRLRIWIFKELPKKSLKIMLRKASLLDLLETPIQLLTWYAHALGQDEIQITEEMLKVEQL